MSTIKYSLNISIFLTKYLHRCVLQLQSIKLRNRSFESLRRLFCFSRPLTRIILSCYASLLSRWLRLAGHIRIWIRQERVIGIGWRRMRERRVVIRRMRRGRGISSVHVGIRRRWRAMERRVHASIICVVAGSTICWITGCSCRLISLLIFSSINITE